MAIGEVSDNPSANMVTRPTNVQLRDQDIENKLRLYGINTAFRNGKFPSNKQIDVALSTAVESDMLKNPNKNLSEEGRILVGDLRDVIEYVKLLLLKKNSQEELQNFLYHTMQASTAPKSTGVRAPLEKDKVKDQGSDALRGLRTLGRLLITNGQFRKLVDDATLLLRDMASDTATTAAQRIRPDEEQLRQIDEPAPDDTWHENTPSFGRFKPSSRGNTKEMAGDIHQESQDMANDGTGESVGRRDNIAQYKSKAMGYLKENVPQERRERVIDRLKKMVVEVQQHEDYQDAIDTLLGLAEEYARHGRKFAADSKSEAQRTAEESNLKAARAELKTLLENFANSTSMDDMLDAADNLIADAKEDRQFRKWAINLDSYVRKCLKEDGFILQDQAKAEWNEIYEDGRYFLQERYKDHTDRFREEMERWFKYVTNDPDSVALGQKVQKLFADLGQDKQGSFKFKKDLWKDMTSVVIPGFFERIRYVPVPRIEVNDPKIDVVIENLVLESENLMPNILEIHADNFFRFGRQKITSKSIHRYNVHVSQIQCDLKDVAYWIKKKQGFPSLTDTGVVDILLGGKGLSFDLKLSSAGKTDSHAFFKVDRVNVNVSGLKIIVKKSQHKILFGLFKPLLMKIMKPAIQKAVEQQIRQGFDQLDEKMYEIQHDVEEHQKSQMADDKEETVGTGTLYVQAIQKQLVSFQEAAKKKTPSQTKSKMALTTEDSMFKEIKLPGGISTKASRYVELAREGDNWHSPVFDLGTAQPTANLKAAEPITRKSPHQNARATRHERTSGSGSQHHPSHDQPRMSTANESMRTAVEDPTEEFEGKHHPAHFNTARETTVI